MDYRAFEQRLLDTIFTTDVQLTPASIAFLYKLPVQEAADLLQQAAVAGLLNIESDDDGNLLYSYPNRIKLPAKDSGAPRRALSTDHGYNSTGALIRVEAGPSILVTHASSDAGRDADFDRLPSLLMDSLPADPASASEGPASYGGHTRCPFCNEQIVVGAKKCRHCHEYLDPVLRDLNARQSVNQVSVALQHVPQQQQTAITQWTGTQAALLSLFMPGLGQMCSGRVPAGLLWMMFTIMGYLCLIVPGFILHVLCVINASRLPRQATT